MDEPRAELLLGLDVPVCLLRLRRPVRRREHELLLLRATVLDLLAVPSGEEPLRELPLVVRAGQGPPMRFAPVVSSFCLLTALLLAPPTFAAPSEADKVRARALMDQGDALVEKQQLSDALAKYREAHTLMKVTTTGIEVARVLEKLGRLVEAREVAAEVAAIPAAPGESPALTSARNAAAALLKGLDARVPSVTVRMRGASSDAVLRVDGDRKSVV